MLKVKKYSNNARMEELAKDNMPFMGLEIHGLVSITYSCCDEKLNTANAGFL